MRILYIHGRAQEEFDENELKADWENALKLSFADAGLVYPSSYIVDFPYYAHVLVEQQTEYERSIKEGKYIFRGGENERQQNFENEFITELAHIAQIDHARAALEFNGIENKERGIQNNQTFIYLLKAIDKYVPRLASYSIKNFTKDVSTYLIVPKVKRIIHDLVINKLTKEPTVIVAHSLGTIIAYNILQELEASDYDIRGLITLGSPLGVKAVQRQLTDRIRYPKILKGQWNNFFDPLDIVSLHPLSNPDFNVYPKILNYEVVNDSNNRHSLLHYLSNPKISDILQLIQ